MLLRVRLNGSRYVAAVLATAYAGSACILIPLDLPVEVKSAIVALMALGLARDVWRIALLRSPGAVVAVELRDEDRVTVQTRNGEWCDARLLGTTYTTPHLTVLNLRHEKRLLARHVVIAADSGNAADLRRLRVRLRWGYQKAD
jgi:hypothetical protein